MNHNSTRVSGINGDSNVIEQKIDALLDQMTLVEKVGQLTQRGTLKDEDRDMIREGRMGSLLNVRGADAINELQRIAVEESRLGIPLIIGDDVIHGYRTVFPIPLAEASSWDLALLEETAAVAAREASADGIHWIFAPMVDIARDARWGRVAEGAGEDTFLGSEIARARVRGFQRNDWVDRPAITSCPKHFVGYGAAEAGRDYNTVDISERNLREVYFPPFKAALDEGAMTVMAAFHDLNGVPCSANPFILTDVLQKEWGFDGFVVSDWESVWELVPHGVAENREEAARKALLAGVHMDMHAKVYDEHLKALVEQGVVSEAEFNDAVRRVLRVKFALGLFEKPYIDRELAPSLMLNPEHVNLAREMARTSIVLLKNEGGVLPLSDTTRRIAVIGPLADDRHTPLGCWAGQGRAEDVVTVLEGFKLAAGSADIRYAKGCEVNTASEDLLNEALELAKQSDVAVLVVGETADMSGENHNRTSLGIPDAQADLVKAIHATGTSVVLVLLNGRPLSLSWEDANVAAIVEAWHLGTQSGNAIADVLFGKYNPSGKLPMTFPRTVGQVPIYYNNRSTGRPDMKQYHDCEVTPLYPFGYGLSYTSVEYRNVSLSTRSVGIDGEVVVTAEVANVGNCDGEEIVQLYVQDVAASVTRPMKELKGFQKIHLSRGESKTVSFTLSVRDLGFIDMKGAYVVEPGRFNVWVGPNSAEGLQDTFQVMGANES